MWFGESLRCRLGATGWLFSFDLQQIHGKYVPSVLFCGPPCVNRRFCFRQKARVISATSLLISSANPVAVKLFSRARCPPACGSDAASTEEGKWRRCGLGSFDPHLLLAAHLSRSMTATKK